MKELTKKDKQKLISALKSIIKLIKVSKSGEWELNLERPVERFMFDSKEELEAIVKTGIIYHTIINMNLKLSSK